MRAALSAVGALVLASWAACVTQRAAVEDPALRAAFSTRASAAQAPLVVMSFNVRLDMEERVADHHFTKRVHRLPEVIGRWNPAIVGMQEPFGGQVQHLLSEFPEGHAYRALGYNRPGVDPGDLTHPARHNDLQTGILYRTDLLTLLAQDYLWLSKNPRQEGSRDWGTLGVRTVNVARFRVKASGHEVAVFNTHLDVWSEAARRGQAAVLARAVREFSAQHPGAAVFVTGDFNSAPGQTAHRTLVQDGDGLLSDAWEGEGAPLHDVALSFHGWLGVTLTNTYAARAAAAVGLTAHALGFALPLAVPHDLRSLARAALALVQSGPAYPLTESVPSGLWTLGRFHVDWVLHNRHARPLAAAVGDARDATFSSDHFPIVVLFDLAG